MRVLLLSVFVVCMVGLIPLSYAHHLDAEVTPTVGASSSEDCAETNECFSPYQTKIRTGGTITFANSDNAVHTFTSGTREIIQNNVRVSGGPDGVFDSGPTASGGSFSFTFDTAGTYDYFCMIHPWMTGEIIVKDGYGTSHAIEPNSKAKQNFNFYSYGEYRAGEIDCELKHYFEIVVGISIRGVQEEKATGFDRSKVKIKILNPNDVLLGTFTGYVPLIDESTYTFNGIEIPEEEVGKSGSYTIQVFYDDIFVYDNTFGYDGFAYEVTSCDLGKTELREITMELGSKLTFWSNIDKDDIQKVIDFEKVNQLSPEALQSFSPEHLDITSPYFCGVLDSRNLITEEKQVFLEICENLVELIKVKFRNALTEIDEALIIAETKINAMDISDEYKAQYISQVKDDVKIAKQTMIDVGAEYIPRAENIINEQKEIQKTRLELAGEGGGCLIATAAFGSEMSPQVQLLREIRDNTVLQTESGSAFMAGFNQFYYSFSPAVADYERENPAFKETVKLALTPLLTSLTLLQYADIDSESEMLGYGIGIILLNIGMYFVVPAILVMKVRKKI